MIIPAQEIRVRGIFRPFSDRTQVVTPSGKRYTYGLGPAGYDVRIDQDLAIEPGMFILASTYEHIQMPNDLLAVVHDKSSWARQGLSVFNTVIEPGWYGYLTLELVNQSKQPIFIDRWTPIAQVVMHRLTEATQEPYGGKYQNQGMGPQGAF